MYTYTYRERSLLVYVEPHGAAWAAQHWHGERPSAVAWLGGPLWPPRTGGSRKNTPRRLGGAVLAGAFSGRVALTSHQTNSDVVWLVGDSGNFHAQGACRIRQAGMGANANGPFETVIFHVMVNVCMEGN